MTAKARKSTAGAEALKREQAKKAALRKRAADAAALSMQTTEGMAPAFRSQVIAAQRKAESDPKAKALVDRAEIEKRVRDTRKQHGIGEAVKPVQVGGELVTDPDMIPMSVAQRREQRRKNEKA
jgi:hypothetical protein